MHVMVRMQMTTAYASRSFIGSKPGRRLGLLSHVWGSGAGPGHACVCVFVGVDLDLCVRVSLCP